MTKNLSSKGHRGGNPKTAAAENKKSQQNSNATTNHQTQNENAAAIGNAVLLSVQKASIDLKMVSNNQCLKNYIESEMVTKTMAIRISCFSFSCYFHM